MKNKQGTKNGVHAWMRWLALGGIAAASVGFGIKLTAAPNDWTLAQKPLYLGTSEAPLMMMVMSRDERLFTKAYSDYSDLDGDGRLDTTYQDNFSYEGYFDPNLCYSYSSGQFKASAVAGGDNEHSCSGTSDWSGNFLNWVTMSRLDILRYVLYGGSRQTDSTSRTVLERTHIPNDLHAWVKVYAGADINEFTPYSSSQSFCNASLSSDGPPLMRVASGSYTEWAATAVYQCLIHSETQSDRSDTRRDSPSSAIDHIVRVEVCDPAADESLRESFCRSYGDGATTHYKPSGLLQSYGESNRLRFGMISGSYENPRSGGVLRRNIGRIAGNGPGCASGNEIDVTTGRFCNQEAGDEGIINAVNRFRLTQWNGWKTDGKWLDCPSWGILNRGGFDRDHLNNPGAAGSGSHNCSAWGNPIAEMYAEALRYITGSSATTDFGDAGNPHGLPTPSWDDPYRSPADGGNAYCADCNILVLSSSLPSFDSDEIPTIPIIDGANTATNEVGSHEGISGQYLVGRVGALGSPGASINTHEDLCSPVSVSGLGAVRGICPDSPSVEGSYLVAGLAHQANTRDLRPGLQGKPSSHQNTVTTYGVALADNLPKFDIPVGGGLISLAPLCQASPKGTGLHESGWRTCFLGSVGVGTKRSSVSPDHVYGRELEYDAAGNAVAGSFSLVWEDSLWGNDYDNDVVAMLTYCVGAACSAQTNPNHSGPGICWRADESPDACNSAGSPIVGPNEMLVRIENLSAYAGNEMLSGFAVTGSSDDGVYRLALRPGDSNGSVLTTTANPRSDWDPPKVMRFSAGASDAGLLESPLWYAAKYGGSVGSDGVPIDGEWDSRESGQPDNYFFARDPGQLRQELERIFEEASSGSATTAGGGAGARIGDASFTIEAGFDVRNPDENSGDWIGYLRASEVKPTGELGDLLWDVAAHMPSPSNRNIYTALTPTIVDASGVVTDAVEAAAFVSGALGDSEAERLAALGVPTPAPAWLGDTPSSTSLIEYIRGVDVPGFRYRSETLGSIVNSQPQVAAPQDDFGYGSWMHAYTGDPVWKTALGEGYKTYLETTKAGRNPMVYVGANDGMLHGFNASRLTSDGGGDEVFAFIPAGARNHLYELTNPNYDHRYFVDGELTVADVSFSAAGAGAWRTVLVGSTGAGGAAVPSGGTAAGYGSVFALNVSNPAGFGANDVLWELSGENDQDLGFVLGKPLIVPVAGAGGAPRWVAIFGNGPNSSNGRPVLFVVDIQSGQVLSRLMPGSADYAVRNGLMNLAPVAVANHHGLVDAVYGGDLQGNLWKFDVSGGNPASWGIAFGGMPLFTAGIGSQVQPITSGIEVSSGPGGGISVFFGTGSYFAEEDRDTDDIQSLYAIWDNLAFPVSGRGTLVGQELQEGVAGSGYRFRNIEAANVSYAANRGWYVDLMIDDEAIGERFIGTPRLQSGKVIFVAYEPSEAMVCSAGGGVNWEYALNMMTGAGGMSGISVSPGGPAVCEGADCAGIALEGGPSGGDGPSAPVRNTNIFVPPLAPCDPSDPTCLVDDLIEAEQCTFVLRAPGADPLFMPRPCGRQSWRQLR